MDVKDDIKTDAEIREALDEEMSRTLQRTAFTLQEKMALACRKLAGEGHSDYLAGQVTVRCSELPGFWTIALGRNFGEVRTGDIIRIDETMRVIDGDTMPNPGVRFHLWLYDKYPTVSAIVHTHPPFASALSMTGKQLVVSHMDNVMFFDNCAYLPDWPGLPVGNDEGRLISGALGNKQAALLAHHGIITVGPTIEHATYLAVALENAARMQIRACSVGEIVALPEQHCAEARGFLLGESVVNATFDSWARMAAADYPDSIAS